MPVPEPDVGLGDSLKPIIRASSVKMRRTGKLQPLTDEMIRNHVRKRYTGTKRLNCMAALASLHADPVRKDDAAVKVFGKIEKLPIKPIIGLKPRVISFRDGKGLPYRFLISLLRYLCNLEHTLYSVAGILGPGLCFAKSMNVRRRAERILEMIRELGGKCIYASLDCSAFGGHVNVFQLRLCHDFYKRSLHPFLNVAQRAELAKLLDWQLNNRCRSPFLSYTVKGKRMSGDLDTGLGNSIINAIMLRSFMERIGVPETHFRYLIDGDDCVVLVNEEYQLVFTSEAFVSHYLRFGHELKVEELEPLKSAEQVLFCQCRPVLLSNGFCMVRDPFKMMTAPGINANWFWRTEDFYEYFHAVSHAELHLNKGVPVLASYWRMCQRFVPRGFRARKTRDVLKTEYRYQRENFGVVLEPTNAEGDLTLETRASFARAFGITLEQQFLLELSFEQWRETQQLCGDQNLQYGLAPFLLPVQSLFLRDFGLQVYGKSDWGREFNVTA